MLIPLQFRRAPISGLTVVGLPGGDGRFPDHAGGGRETEVVEGAYADQPARRRKSRNFNYIRSIIGERLR
jgi:hypothetical protein